MRTTTIIHSAWTLAVMLFIAGLVGCNTTEGAGKDIKKTGEAIEDAADDAKN